MFGYMDADEDVILGDPGAASFAANLKGTRGYSALQID